MTIGTALTVIAAVLVLIFTFVVGAAFGCILSHGTRHPHNDKSLSPKTDTSDLPEDKVARMKREAEEDAEAFSLLMGYSRDLAYGQASASDFRREREGRR